MTTFLLLATGVVLGFTVGWVMAVRQERSRAAFSEPGRHAPPKRESHSERKGKVLAFVEERRRVKNEDIEELLGLSHETATRYLAELVREDRIVSRVDSLGSAYYERM